MTASSIIGKWSAWGPCLLSILRIAAAIMFIQAGTLKLFAFPIGMPPDGSTAHFLTEVWFGGVLEAFGGALLLVGLFTRPVAFILSGEMAVAYFQFHAPQGFWTVVNGGGQAVLFCFLWLYISAAGAGPWSLDAKLGKKILSGGHSGVSR
jgi:putative oxidoreductase